MGVLWAVTLTPGLPGGPGPSGHSPPPKHLPCCSPHGPLLCFQSSALGWGELLLRGGQQLRALHPQAFLMPPFGFGCPDWHPWLPPSGADRTHPVRGRLPRLSSGGGPPPLHPPCLPTQRRRRLPGGQALLSAASSSCFSRAVGSVSRSLERHKGRLATDRAPQKSSVNSPWHHKPRKSFQDGPHPSKRQRRVTDPRSQHWAGHSSQGLCCHSPCHSCQSSLEEDLSAPQPPRERGSTVLAREQPSPGAPSRPCWHLVLLRQ